MAPSGWEVGAAARSLHLTAPAQPLLLFFFLLFLPEIRMLTSLQKQGGSAALQTPKTRPEAVSEHFQELLVIVFLPVNVF